MLYAISARSPTTGRPDELAITTLRRLEGRPQSGGQGAKPKPFAGDRAPGVLSSVITPPPWPTDSANFLKVAPRMLGNRGIPRKS